MDVLFRTLLAISSLICLSGIYTDSFSVLTCTDVHVVNLLREAVHQALSATLASSVSSMAFKMMQLEILLTDGLPRSWSSHKDVWHCVVFICFAPFPQHLFSPLNGLRASF